MASESTRIVGKKDIRASKDVLDILSALDCNEMRFTQLMQKTGINPKILDKRIKTLVNLNAIEKKSGRYSITETGRRLLNAMI